MSEVLHIIFSKLEVLRMLSNWAEMKSLNLTSNHIFAILTQTERSRLTSMFEVKSIAIFHMKELYTIQTRKSWAHRRAFHLTL